MRLIGFLGIVLPLFCVFFRRRWGTENEESSRVASEHCCYGRHINGDNDHRRRWNCGLTGRRKGE